MQPSTPNLEQRTTGILAVGALGIVATATMSHFVNDCFTSLLTPLLPHIRDQYQISIAQTSVLVALLSFVGSMMQPLWGAVGDYIDRRVLAALGPVLCATGMSLMGYAPNFWLLALLVAGAGIGSAIFHPSGAHYVATNSNVQKRALYASIFSAGGTAGLACGPLIAQALGIKHLPYMLPLGLAMGLVSFLVMPSTRSNKRQHKTLRDYLEVMGGPVLLLWGMSVLRSLSTVAYGSLIGFEFKAQGLEIHTYWTLFVFSIASSVGGIYGGWISDRLGRVVVLRSSVLVLIPLFVALILSSPTQVWFYPLAFLVGALSNATIPVAVVAAQEFAPGNIATASAVMMGFSWGTSGVLFLLVGWMADFIGPISAMLVTVALLLPSVWLVLRLPEPPRAKLE